MPGNAPLVLSEPVRKIAILRANGLGDWIFALPAVEALRAAYPQAEITLLGTSVHAALMNGRPGPVDRVIVTPPARGVNERDRREQDQAKDHEAMARFFRAMRAESFDLALQLHGGGRYSNPFLLELGASYTAGMRTADAAMLDAWVPYVDFQSEIIRYLEVVALVGATPHTLEPSLTVVEQDLEAGRAAVPPGWQPLVVMHPGATDPRRRWPPHYFAQVADGLVRAGARVVLVGLSSERLLTLAVSRSMQRPAEDVSGRLSLSGLVGLLARTALIIGNDSGPLHLGAAVGVSTVGIYWCGNLINGGPLGRSRHRPAISWQMHCPVCRRHCMREQCQHQETFVSDVSVEEVLTSALDLLSSPPSPMRSYAM